MDKLYLVIPAYNEAENIQSVICSWYPVLTGKDENSKLVVADSESTDDTHNILLGLQSKYPKLEVISNTGKLHGQKVIALYDFAIRSGADYIFQTDSDGQTNPDEFYEFWEMRGKYDAVIGKRLSRDDGKPREFVEHVLCKILYMYFRILIPDANAPFRLMKAELVAKYLKKLPSDYNLPNVMLTTYFTYFKENITFKSITFKPRQAGINSINIYKIVKSGWRARVDFCTFKKDMRKKL